MDILRSLLSSPLLSGGSDVVYFGDGAWDLRAAEELGLRFVGIGSGAGADRLRSAGAPVVIPDFSDGRLIAAALSS